VERSSGPDDEVPVHMVSVQPPATGPSVWLPDGPRPIGQGVETEFLAGDLPDLPEFERELPSLRAGGTGQAHVGVAEPVPDLGEFGTCDGDGD
jgi:hypothetical protein